MKDAARFAPVVNAQQAALEVLLNNAHGPYGGLPRTAGWGYPEPYTRDLMISSLGMLASENEELRALVRRVLLTAASHQTPHGHIPSLIHDPDDVGASDTTPLFLMALAIYRRVTGEHDFLEEAAERSLTWMEYQTPGDRVMVGQLPTSDWRDEQWVLGHGLFVNTVVYAYLRLFRQHGRAALLRLQIGDLAITQERQYRFIHQHLVSSDKPYYPLWSYKVFSSERFDLLGNSLAILCGIAAPERAQRIITWVETECAAMRERGILAVGLPPNLFPFILPDDPDWLPRYERLNRPGEYHNGGIWPFICGFYIAALQAAGRNELAENALLELTRVITLAQDTSLAYGFNEWVRAQDGTAQGQDWQTWSAAMYLYAAACVERGSTPFFDEVRAVTDAGRNIDAA
jgi:hypothetical protein